MDPEQLMTFRKQKTFLTPNNAPDQGVYLSTSSPQINFVIASTPGAYMDPRTLRLQGKYRIVSDTTNTLPQNITDGSAASATSGVGSNPFCGIAGIIDQINISTGNSRTIESIRSYNSYLATTRPFFTSASDVNNGGNLYDATYQIKSTTNALTTNQETDFAIQLRTGFFHNNIIPISEKGTSGCSIQISLCQNNNQIQPFFVFDPSAPEGSPILSTTEFRFEVFDLALTFDTLIASSSLYSKIPSTGVLQFNTVSSIVSTLLSSDETKNFNFGTTNTLAVTHSMIPSIHLNNRKVDSLRLCQPENGATVNGKGTIAPVTAVTYMKSGRMFPYDYELSSPDQALNRRPSAMIIEPAQNSVSLYNNEDSMLSPCTFLGLTSGRLNLVKNIAQPYPCISDPNSLYILGVPMDSARTGVSFARDNYSVRIKSGLDQRSPMTLFTYCLARNLVQYSPAGIQTLE